MFCWLLTSFLLPLKKIYFVNLYRDKVIVLHPPISFTCAPSLDHLLSTLSLCGLARSWTSGTRRRGGRSEATKIQEIRQKETVTKTQNNQLHLQHQWILNFGFYRKCKLSNSYLVYSTQLHQPLTINWKRNENRQYLPCSLYICTYDEIIFLISLLNFAKMYQSQEIYCWNFGEAHFV